MTINPFSRRPSVLACIAERAFLRVLEGGCSVPVAVTSEVLPTAVRLHGGVWSLDGRQHLGSVQWEHFPLTHNDDDDNESSCAPEKITYAAISALNLAPAELAAAERCGRGLAKQLMELGAGVILQEARAENDKQ